MSKEQLKGNRTQNINSVAFLFIGSAQDFDNENDKQALKNVGISFQHSQKGIDDLQQIRNDRDVLRAHAQSLQSSCKVISFDSILSQKYLLKKSQVIDFLLEKLLKYNNYDEINIHFDGPSIKYTGEWSFKDNNILKQEDVLQIIIQSKYRNKVIIISNCNFSNELLQGYNRGRYDELICYFNSFLFISTSLREQNYHSFYQFYNYSCRNCCFVKQLENSNSTELKKLQQDSIDLSTLRYPPNNALNNLTNNVSGYNGSVNNLYSQHRCSFNDSSSQINTGRNMSYQLTKGFETNGERKGEEQNNRNKKQSVIVTRINEINSNNIQIGQSLDIKSQDVSYDQLSTNHTFCNHNQSFKIPSYDSIKYFYSSTQTINH